MWSLETNDPSPGVECVTLSVSIACVRISSRAASIVEADSGVPKARILARFLNASSTTTSTPSLPVTTTLAALETIDEEEEEENPASASSEQLTIITEPLLSFILMGQLLRPLTLQVLPEEMV